MSILSRPFPSLANEVVFVMEQLNAAKGRLRTVLCERLYKPVAEFIDAESSCTEKIPFEYEKVLYRMGVWPLDRSWSKRQVSQILDGLNTFSYKAPQSACRFCQKDYEKHVRDAVNYVRRYFDGLCLDCMDKSKPKTEDYDLDYWYHSELGSTGQSGWDSGCCVRHGEPTWYFSFMGRKEDRWAMQKRIRDGAFANQH